MQNHLVILCYILLKVVREVDFHQGSLNTLSITKSDSALFIAAQNGVVLVVLLPIGLVVIQNEFKMHKNITKVYRTRQIYIF